MVLSSCTLPPDDQLEANVQDETPRSLNDYPLIKHTSDTFILINSLAAYDCVHTSGIGITGEYSEQYARFERLTQLLTGEEWLDLIDHESAVVRLYAFQALEELHSDLLPQAQEQLKNDTTSVCYFSGCIRLTLPLGSMTEMD